MGLMGLMLGVSFTAWFALLVFFIVVPAMCGISFGFRRLYMKCLLKIFDWATPGPARGTVVEDKNHPQGCGAGGGGKPYANAIIARSKPTSLAEEIKSIQRSNGNNNSSSDRDLVSASEFELSDVFYFARCGVESIVDDEVTKCFYAEELESWNLLTRSNNTVRHVPLLLRALWMLGVGVRYGVLLPLRLALAFTGVTLLLTATTFIGLLLPSGSGWRSWASEQAHLRCCRICVLALTAIITFHDEGNVPRNGGICVANHTSPIDVIILASDRCYAMVGQIQGGLMGLMQRSMVRACPHIWFERSEARDRQLVARRLSEHVEDRSKLPILIFPEGTCINNTSVMMFKKGSFEVGATVHPVAIKYDPRFGDAFWNSSKFGMVRYLLRMMSSWAIVCSVWYLPPMRKGDGESAVDFSNRVKRAIAKQGGLNDLWWDGGLKRDKVKHTFKEEQQRLYSRILVRTQEDSNGSDD